MQPETTNQKLAVIVAVIVSFSLALEAGEPKKKPPTLEEIEAKEAAEEEKLLEGKRPETGHEFSARGRLRLALVEEGQTPPAILGIFTADGKSYQVKIANEALRAQLLPFDNKDIALGGKVRNKGKYLIVEEVIIGSGTPAATLRNPRGL